MQSENKANSVVAKVNTPLKLRLKCGIIRKLKVENI